MDHAEQIRFTDGAAYERTIGRWSQLAAAEFLRWLAPSPNLSWIDVGCGNGAFTELLIQRCSPRAVIGVDPAEAQLAYATTRLGGGIAQFKVADAMSLPIPDQSVDAAAMTLVIFFVPDPAKGVSEMARVVKPGGLVTAYAWDMMGGGFPFNAMQTAMNEMGIPPTFPPNAAISRIEAMRELWAGAGLESVETTAYTIHRTYDDFEDLWATSSLTSSVAPKLKVMDPSAVEELKSRMRARSPADPSGRITCSARVTAVKGQAR
jgi:ubiquinone/menaquinone biosynthesis C-methylase UbiE